MGSTRRDRGYLKRQTRDARRALIAACVEKESHATPHTHTHVHAEMYTYYSMLTSIHILQTLCALEEKGRSGKGGVGGVREEREEGRGTGGGEGSMGRGRGGGRGDRGIKVSYSAVMWSTSRKLQLLDTCRGARNLNCYRRCHTPRCDGPGESLAAAVNG